MEKKRWVKADEILPYKKKALDMEERITDLVERMTIMEKVRQMDQYMGNSMVDKIHPYHSTTMANDAVIKWDMVRKVIGTEGLGCIHDLYGTAEVNNMLQKYAIEETRLGIPILFSSEALHGLCRPGCTVFPQQISLAGTWDTNIVFKVGRAIAAETRSFNIHESFSPVIDLARDPRWGRMEETYGEDTYLSGRMAAAMVKGLQGDGLASCDSIAAEPKHFSAYGVPEGGLNCAPAVIGQREHEISVLPVFEAAFAEAGAVNAMCSYNSIDGIPCAANHDLLTGVLRERWGMKGFVRSDLGAIARLHDRHHTADSAREAIYQAVSAGVDMQYYDFSHEFFQETLMELVEEGRIAMEIIDRSVSRILRVKFMLGLFDTPYVDTELSKRVVRSDYHQDIALQAACKSICLLKNENGILPLRKDTGVIAVIGPSAGEARLGDYTPYIEGFETVTLLDGIRQAVFPGTRIIQAKGSKVSDDEIVCIHSSWMKNGYGDTGLTGEYFNHPEMEGFPDVVRTDERIDFNWSYTKPHEAIGSRVFTARWTGKLAPDSDRKGYLCLKCYNSTRLWLDGVLAVDGWNREKDVSRSGLLKLEKGKEYDLRIEYKKETEVGFITLGWNSGDDWEKEAVEAAAQADIAILALGDSTDICGENADRAELTLPPPQRKLLKAVYETGTPVVLVLQNGRAPVLDWEAGHIPAIIEAWYGGEKAGTAIAQVLFGDCSPAGRLPVSFPKSEGQLPVYYNRQPGGNRKYMESDNKALFPFGHGLSYTCFDYSNLEISPDKISEDGEVQVSFSVKNIGSCEGDEVVQLYLQDKFSSVVRPVQELRRFQRIHLDPGQSGALSFHIGRNELKLLDRDMRWVVEPGWFEVRIGKSSEEIMLEGEFEVIRGGSI